MITKNFTAYGLSVVVAFAAAVVLLIATAPLGASADKGTTADSATVIDNAAAGTAVTIKGTHVSGKEACDEGTFAVSTPVGGTAAAPVDAACKTITTGVTVLGTTTVTSLTVTSTSGFPDAGSLIIDGDGDDNLATGAATIEIVDYTSKTTTSFDGLTRARAGTTALATAVGADVWPVVYSQITIGPLLGGATIMNLADGSGFVAGGGVGADIVLAPSVAAHEVVAASLKSGNTFTISGTAGAQVLGAYVAQISGVNTDSATSLFTRTASTTTDGSFKFTLTANTQVSTAGTMTLTIITDKPDAADAEATVAATTPTAVPVLVALVGSDSTEVAAGSVFTLTVLPTKGILGAITAPLCTNVGGTPAPKVGEVLTNCTSQVVYTPLLGAAGTDSFQFTFTNGGETSVAATVSIILPGGAPAPTPEAGFGAALVTGVNLTTYGGGTVAQLEVDATDGDATSVSVTVAGDFIVLVVGAPAFVNQAFSDNFPDGVPAGTVVLVLVG